MPRNFKSWADHSDRWKREARRDGLSPERWNRWRHLSPAARADSNPRNYAQGDSVAKQRRSKLEGNALENMKLTFPQGRESTMRLGVGGMTNKQLRFTADADLGELIDLAARKPAEGQRNPWWYR